MHARILILPPLLLVLIEILAAVFFPHALWGLGSLRHLSALAIAGVVLAASAAGVLSLWAGRVRISPHRRTALIIVAALCLFLLLRAKTQLLGDGFHLLTFLEQNERFYPSNLLDFYLHATLFQHVLRPLFGAGPAPAYAVIGALCGIAFVFAALAFCRTVDSVQDRAVACALVLSGGYMVLFFGYVESYALFFALAAWFLAAATRSLACRTPVTLPVLLFVLACLAHQTAIFLLPALLFLLVMDFRTHKDLKRAVKSLWPGLAAVPFFLALFWALGFDFREYADMLRERSARVSARLFLPLFPDKTLAPFSGVALFSGAHLLDFLNVMLLGAPVALVLLPWTCRKQAGGRDSVLVFLLTAWLCMLAGFFLLKPVLGMFRDWDLFSAPALVSAFLAAYAFARRPVLRSGPVLRFCLVFACVFHGLGWVFVNASERASVARFGEHVDHKAKKGDPMVLSSHDEVLAAHLEKMGALAARDRYLDRQKAALLSAMNEKLRISREYQSRALKLSEEKKWSRVIDLFEKALSVNPNLPNRYRVLIQMGKALERSGDPARAYAAFEDAARVNPAGAEAQNNMGAVRFKAGDLENAEQLYKKALAVSPGYGSAHYNLAVLYLARNEPGPAADHYEAAVKNGAPPNPALEKAIRRGP
jgi:tetratricopeptide (TPR) repeat protein